MRIAKTKGGRDEMKNKYLGLKKFNMRRHYILTKPKLLEDVDKEEDLFFDQIDYKLREKAQRLQARRWRKLRHQWV